MTIIKVTFQINEEDCLKIKETTGYSEKVGIP